MNINKKINSINFKTLAYLILFSVTILLLLWVIQITFLDMFYTRYQQKAVEEIAVEIDKTNLNELHYTLENLAYEKNLCMEYIYSDGMTIAYNQRIPGCLLIINNTQVVNAKNTLIREDKELNALTLRNVDNEAKTLLYAVKVENGYVFINAPLEDINPTTNILRGQLIYITFISIFLACLISYFLAKKITGPITNITKETKKISRGEELEYEKTGIFEIDELVDTLNQAQTEIVKTDEIRRDLLANVGHDLKTPLTMIKAYAEMVKDFSYKNTKKREEHLDIITSEVDRLTILVNDIVSLSKLEANAEKIDLTEYDLAKEINEIVKRYAIIKETENYQFVVDIPKEMLVEADKNKLNQVIYNLINNAINYTGNDNKVIIKATEVKKQYLIEIIDTGKGIKPEEINYIWDKYYKNDKNHKRNVVGTGIGLSIVKLVLNQHKFEFGVKSELKVGSNFYFKIPKKNQPKMFTKPIKKITK